MGCIYRILEAQFSIWLPKYYGQFSFPTLDFLSHKILIDRKILQCLSNYCIEMWLDFFYNIVR